MVALHALNGRWPSVTVNAGVIARRHAPERRGRDAASSRSTCVRRPSRRSRPRRPRSSGSPPTAVDGRDAPRFAASPRIRRWRRRRPSARLADLAIAIAAELGFELRDAATGGASDANTTAAAGLPTLDGLGPIGGDDHSADEWLDLSIWCRGRRCLPG